MSVTIQEARERFTAAGFEKADRYEKGTAGKGGAWAAAKSRAKENFGPAMQEVLSKNLFEKGLDRADAQDYDDGVKNKGVNNWGTNIQASGGKWEERTQKFVAAWNDNLPTKKGGRRSQANQKRMLENSQRFMTLAGK